jgi:hypothetical protein
MKKSKLTTSFIVSTLTSPVKLAFGVIMALSITSSCSDPAVVGIELAPGNNQIGVVFKEFTLPAKLVLLDSFNTTNQGVLIVGNEEDSFFGKTEGIGYSRLFYEEREAKPPLDAVLDSVGFKFKVVSVNGSNLDRAKTYSVHRLTEALRDTAYYNVDKLQYESSPISVGSIVFGGIKDTLATMKVDKNFGADLFDKIRSGSEFDDLFSFRRYFPGIAIKSKDGDNTTAGIEVGLNTGFFFYYHNLGDTIAKTYRVTTASSRSFNGVTSDRTGTPTQSVVDTRKDYDVGTLVGMKANLGMVIKLDTSPLDEFLDSLKGITFNQAELIIGGIETVPVGQNPIPWFTMYLVDNKNEIISRSSDKQPLTVQRDGQPQVDFDSNGKEQPAILAPAVAFYNADKRQYVMPISSHLNALYRGKIQRKDWMLYGDSPLQDSPGDDFKRSFRQFIVDKNNIKIKVIYSKTR